MQHDSLNTKRRITSVNKTAPHSFKFSAQLVWLINLKNISAFQKNPMYSCFREKWFQTVILSLYVSHGFRLHMGTDKQN